MRNIRILITTVLLLSCLCGFKASAINDGVTGKENFRLRYVINVAELDTTFSDNNSKLKDIRKFLSAAATDSLMHITGVDFRGTASPDGSYEFNVWLSENRLRSFKELVREYIDIPDSLIFAQSGEIPWTEFRMKVAESDLPQKESILEIIDEGPELVKWTANRHIDHRLLKLKKLEGGKVWEELKNPILYDLRYGDATFYYIRLLPEIGEITKPVTVVRTSDIYELLPWVHPVYETWIPRIYIKSNLIGWAALSANVAFEFDLGRHWSFTLPVYYNALDYFKSTIKFRNFTLQPEFRYWPRVNGANDGFFIGAHFGMMYYNFAIGGPYRYQDRKGHTPALGGGVAVGYRKPISKNKRWHVEFSAGAGAYKLDYDVFHNTPDYKEGQWVRRKKKTFFGLDQAAITISYNFGLKRFEKRWEKGGEL